MHRDEIAIRLLAGFLSGRETTYLEESHIDMAIKSADRVSEALKNSPAPKTKIPVPKIGKPE